VQTTSPPHLVDDRPRRCPDNLEAMHRCTEVKAYWNRCLPRAVYQCNRCGRFITGAEEAPQMRWITGVNYEGSAMRHRIVILCRGCADNVAPEPPFGPLELPFKGGNVGTLHLAGQESMSNGATVYRFRGRCAHCRAQLECSQAVPDALQEWSWVNGINGAGGIVCPHCKRPLRLSMEEGTENG
jgi:DNA-directed RNA polymerase subunit RPC12/RpoP